MKKYVVSGLLFLMALSVSGCGTPADGDPARIAAETEKFAEQGPVWTQDSLEGYLNRESNAEMAYAGPFYFGSFDGMAPASKSFSAQRAQKVDEVIEVIDEAIDVMTKLDDKLREEREIFTWYIKEIQKIDESTKSYTDQVLGATKGNVLSESLSNLLVMKNNANKMEMGSAWGYLQFQKYGAMVELTNLYSVEAASLLSRSGAMYYLLESDPNKAYQELNVQYIAKIDPVSEQVSEILSELYYKNALATYGEKLIFTADYYFAKDTIKTLDEQIAKAQTAFSEYGGGNELVSAEMLALLQKKLADMKAYRDNIVAYLESIPTDELISKETLAFVPDSSPNFLIPVAYAQSDIPGWFQQKVKDVIKTAKFAKDMSFAAVRVTGKKIKDTYDTSGAHEVVKDGAQILNAGLEAANSSVEVSIHGLQGIYYGDMTWADFKKKIESEKKELHDRFVAGTLGKDQYDEMIHQVDQFQKNTGRFIDNMGEFAGDMTGIISGQPKVGKFVKDVTRNVGNEAKGVLDTATDFTKNIAIIMHPETSKEDTRTAILGVYTALKGIKDKDGKLVEVELPDLVDITKEKALEQAVKELGLEQEEEEEFIDQLKGMFKDQLKGEETKSDEKKEGETKDETTKKPETDKPTTGTTGGTSSDAKPEATTSGSNSTTPTDPTTEAVIKILSTPGLTEEEIADLIIAEIVKGLPPTDGSKNDKEDEEENKDIDNDGIENEYDNCPQESNADQADTDNDSLGNLCDPDCSGDTDGDTVCDEIDNCPNDANRDQSDIDNDGIGNVCDEDAPQLSEIAGTWPGTITVREVYVDEEFRKQAEAEGCDFSEVEASKDVPKPVSISITPTSETGGNLVISGADDGGQNIPFTYVDGVLKASLSKEEMAMNIEMSFGRNTSSGSVDLDYMGGNAKVKAALDLTK